MDAKKKEEDMEQLREKKLKLEKTLSETQTQICKVANNIKRINIKEFRELGYLQELNRRFLHPLGLALEVITDKEDRTIALGGVWDYRDDPEGICFDIKGRDEVDKKEMKQKAKFIDGQIKKRSEKRIKLFGSIIEEF